MWNLLAIAFGGALGAACRYGISVGCRRWLGAHFAFGTLFANVAGCFLIGLLIPLGTGATPRWNAATHSALTVGFLGALTTFSTFGFETLQFAENARHHAALLNVALNLVLGLAGVAAGLAVGRFMST